MSDRSIPQAFRFVEGKMVPLNPDLARRQFEEGGTYRLEVYQDRSAKSHEQLFAVIGEAFDNLPEEWKNEFRTAEDLRKYLLIKANHYEYDRILTGSNSDARGLSQHLRPREGEGYRLVSVEGPVIHQWWAKSISKKAVDRSTFQKIKQDCFEILADMLGVTVEELVRNTGKAA